MAKLREDYWIPRARTVVKGVIRRCKTCIRLSARPSAPRMSDLPPARLAVGRRPFTFVGIDCFGPFLIRRGRSEVKRYGLILTCMTIRAVHLEVLPSLTSDAFIDGLRRFVARRGVPERLFSDNGTNFVGACRELGDALREVNAHLQLRGFMLQNGISWSFNPPAASHMGGVWERMIRSVRRAFDAVTRDVTLDDFELQTVMCEVENVINGRPITPVSTDVDDANALTPNHLLRLCGDALPSPAICSEKDKYRRRWRYIQGLVNTFWSRWTTEYLPLIQQRQKWVENITPLSVGDVVIMADDLNHRNRWPLARVTALHPGRDGTVRSCSVKHDGKVFERPVTRLVLLESCEE